MPEKYIIGGATNNGANIVEWYVEKFLSNTFKNIGEAIEAALQIAPGCDGLLMLPYLHGERAPIWNASAKGVFFGVQQQHTPLHFLRSIVEAICFSIAQLIELIEKNTDTIQVLHASGGFIKTNGWVQLLADITGKPIEILEASDASAKGAAMLGLMALGIADGFKEIHATEKKIFPDMQLHLSYANNKKMFALLYQSLQPFFSTTNDSHHPANP
jgi:gluconokinase